MANRFAEVLERREEPAAASPAGNRFAALLEPAEAPAPKPAPATAPGPSPAAKSLVEKALDFARQQGGRLVDQVRAVDRAAYSALGGPKLAGAIDAIGAQATGARPLDAFQSSHARAQAEADEAMAKEPVAATVGHLAANIVPGTAVTKLAATATPLARVGIGAAEGAVSSALGSRGDPTTSEGRKQIGKDALVGTALGAVSAAPTAAGAYSKGGGATKEFRKQLTHDLTEGANPTHARRAVSDDRAADTIVEWTERNPTARKAIEKKDRPALIAAAQKTLDEGTRTVTPIYKRFDKAAGPMLHEEIDDALLSHLEKLRMSPDSNEGAIAAFEHARKNLADKMAMHEFRYTHQQMREWVTGLIKDVQRTKGTINETPAVTYAEELHEVADGILKNRLRSVAEAHPKLDGDLKVLQVANRDISAAVRAKDVAENSEKLANWKGKTMAERATGAAAKAVTGAALGGLAGGIPGAIAGAAAPVAVGGMTKAGVKALAALSRAAKEGKPVAKFVEDALASGVPERVIRGFLSRPKGAPLSDEPPPE